MQLCSRPKLRGWGGWETHPVRPLQPAVEAHTPAPFHFTDSSSDFPSQPPAASAHLPTQHCLISLSRLQFIIKVCRETRVKRASWETGCNGEKRLALAGSPGASEGCLLWGQDRGWGCPRRQLNPVPAWALH